MQTNFGTNTANLNADTTPWVRDKNKQPQPIAINTSLPLVITASPFGSTGCDSRGNAPGTLNLNDPDRNNDLDGTVNVTHAVTFGNPLTFNGDCDSNLGNCSSYNDKPRVKGDSDQAVQFLKKGFVIQPSLDANNDGDFLDSGDRIGYGGYDVNNDGDFNDAGDQPSLGKFLYDQGFAIPINGGNPNSLTTEFKIPTTNQEITDFLATSAASSLTAAQRSAFNLLGDDQRIVAFEVGQRYPDKNNDGSSITSGKNPGFDLQDNIFIVTSDVFKKKFNPNCFGGSGCP